MKTTVQENIVETFKNLNKTLSLFSDSQLNMIPYQGSWTPGQVTQHIILASSGYPKLFAGKTEKTTRKHDEKIKDIDALFLNFDKKFDAPDFLIPEEKQYSKNSLNSKLLKIESELLDSAEKCDLTVTCLNFQVPGFEKFTIYEWLDFVIVHTQRHTKQLNDIFRYITKL